MHHLLLLAGSWSADALACSCEEGLIEALPAADAVDVPTSAWIFQLFVYVGEVETRLFAPDGSEVPLVVEEVVTGHQTVHLARPSAPLAPSTTYTVRTTTFGHEQARVFTTGSGPDTASPAGAAIQEVALEDGWLDCGGTLYLGVVVASGATEPVVFEVEVDDDEAFVDPHRMFGAWPTFAWGHPPCGPTWPSIGREETWCFRARTLDGSGNASDWSGATCASTGTEPDTDVPVDTDVADTDVRDTDVADTDVSADTNAADTSGEAATGGGCGCRAVVPGAAWPLGLLGLLAARRRPRREPEATRA